MYVHFLRPNIRAIARFPALVLALLALSACLPPAFPQVIKIGLVAPFEGADRDVGYDAVYAARLAIREMNASGSLNRWRLELVSYDDRGDPDFAVTAARNLAADEEVIAVIGHFQATTTAAAQTTYLEAGLPLLALGANDETYPDPETLPGSTPWIEAYRAVGPHTPEPGRHAIPSYEAVRAIASAIVTVASTGSPSRENLALALTHVEQRGLLGNIHWRPANGAAGHLLLTMQLP